MVAVDVPNEVLALVSRELAIKHGCLPWFVEGLDLYLIMADPTKRYDNQFDAVAGSTFSCATGGGVAGSGN